MTDLELDSIAEGMFKYVVEKTEAPLDAVAIVGMILLKIFSSATDGTVTIETFAKDFHRSLIESYNARTAQGTKTRQ